MNNDMSRMILIQAVLLLLFFMNERKLKSSRPSSSMDRFSYYPNFNKRHSAIKQAWIFCDAAPPSKYSRIWAFIVFNIFRIFLILISYTI